jgi:hypothetical protein
LIGSHLDCGTIAVPSDEPSFVVASGEVDECGPQFFDVAVIAFAFFQGCIRACERRSRHSVSLTMPPVPAVHRATIA